jgi:uncharacterized peroxidase-related enzyme
MAYINTIPKDQAEGVLREIYDEQIRNTGSVSNYHQLLSLRPDAIRAYGDLVKTFRGKMRLRRYELIMMAAARIIGCHYCLLSHGGLLLKNGFTEDQIEAIIRGNYVEASLSDEEITIMRFAEKLSHHAYEVRQTDVDGLRDLGLSDEDILDISLAAAARNFQSRILVGLGIEIEEEDRALEARFADALGTVGREASTPA